MKREITFLLMLFLFLTASAQITLQMSSTENANCNGIGCFYNGPSILINEVMLAPTTNDGSIFGGGPVATQTPDNLQGEWIELFNPDWCRSVDISCYFLGNNATDNGTNYGGGFVIPQGTIVPPLGFCVIRGVHAPAVPSHLLVANGGKTVEIVVTSNRTCISGGWRLWFPNAGGWFAFYNANGVPQDAICWPSLTNFCTTCSPCIPPGSGCSYTGTLASYSAIPASRMTQLFPASYVDLAGQTHRRIPDGASWVLNSQSAPTMGNCNAACITNFESNCTGMAIVSATGGVPPYEYRWNDAQSQSRDTATGLCSGVYTVTVTDASGFYVIDSVFVEDHFFASYDTVSICFNESYVFQRKILIESGTYIDTLTTPSGCDSILSLHLTVFPELIIELGEDTIICKSSSSSLVLDAGQGDYTYEWSTGETTQTIIVDETGKYSVTISNLSGCSATDEINLKFIDLPQAVIENENENFCDNYQTTLSINTTAPEILWSTGESGNSIVVSDFGEYSVVISEDNCLSYDTLTIEFCCPEDPMLPNIITPSDQNGINDFFEFPPELPYKEMDIYIYNRWGKLIYKSSGSKFRWDGTVNGKIENGIFYYVIYLKDNCTFHGSLTVL